MNAPPQGSNILGSHAPNASGVDGAGAASVPVTPSSHSTIGLMDENATMTRSLSMRPAGEGIAADTIETFDHDGYLWNVVGQHLESIRSASFDWLDLASYPCATLIKQNDRRDVWRVRCGDRDYFAKLYHPGNLLARMKSLARGSTAACEWSVGRYAATNGIAAVVPVATATRGPRGIGGPSLLVTEAVPDVEPLGDYWLRVRDDRERSMQLTDSLARLIARAHQCGFRHGDMHPGNILVRRFARAGEAIFVDLHNVRVGRAVSMREAIANLAQLHQWFRKNSNLTRRFRFLETYISYRARFADVSPLARSFPISPREMIEQVSLRANEHADRIWSKRDRRAHRTGSYFVRIRTPAGWRGHALLQSKHPAVTAQAARQTFAKSQWRDWLQCPLVWVDPTKQTLMKDSHTATICKADLPTDPPAVVIVKRHLGRNLMKRLAQIFGPSRNMRAWKTANQMLNRDLPVAQPIAIVERFMLGLLRMDSILFTDYVVGSIDIETFLTRELGPLRQARRRQVKDRLIGALVRLMRMFHERGFCHRDFKASNLLINWSPPYLGAPRLTFIDMDGIKFVKRAGESQRTRALVRLCVSLMNSPMCSRTDLLRFLKRDMTRYGSTSAAWKSRWRECEALVADKQRHKAHRREWKLKHYGRE